MSQLLARLLLGLGGALVVATVFLFGFWIARRHQMILLRSRHERGEAAPAPKSKGKWEVFVISFVSSLCAGIVVYIVAPMLPVPFLGRSPEERQAATSEVLTEQASEVAPTTLDELDQAQVNDYEPAATAESDTSVERGAMSEYVVGPEDETSSTMRPRIATSPGVELQELGLSKPLDPPDAEAAGERILVSGAVTSDPWSLHSEPGFDNSNYESHILVAEAATTCVIHVPNEVVLDVQRVPEPRVLVESALAAGVVGLESPSDGSMAAGRNRILVEGAATTHLDGMSKPDLDTSND